MRVRTGSIVGLAVVLMGASNWVAPSLAAPAWQVPVTVDSIRGVPAPQVGIDGSGKASIVYSTAVGGSIDGPMGQLALRAPGGPFNASTAGAGDIDQQVDVNSAGATALVGVTAFGQELVVRLVPAPGLSIPVGRPPYGRRFVIDTGGMAVREPRVALDGAGRATVVWTSPPRPPSDPGPARLYQVTVGSDGPSPVERLGDGERCADASVASNDRGDTVVRARCDDTVGDVFVRPAGGVFGQGEGVFDWGPTAVTIGGDGTVMAFAQNDDSTGTKGDPRRYRVDYAVRPPGGGFGSPVRMRDVAGGDREFRMEAQEDGRVVASWVTAGGVAYAVRPPGGDFGARGVVKLGRPRIDGLGLAVAPRGPAVLSWRGAFPSGPAAKREQVFAALVRADGSATAATPVSLRGDLPAAPYYPFSFAVNESGQAIGAWEQRCGAGGRFAVMSAVLDARRGSAGPPCQDVRAPNVTPRPRQMRLVGRTLRVRLGCNEDCRVGVRVLLLQAGRGRPLAVVRTRVTRTIASGRYRRFAVRLSRAQTAKVAVARRDGRRVTVRLRLSVSDDHDNSAVRRVAVPLRR